MAGANSLSTGFTKSLVDGTAKSNAAAGVKYVPLPIQTIPDYTTVNAATPKASATTTSSGGGGGGGGGSTTTKSSSTTDAAAAAKAAEIAAARADYNALLGTTDRSIQDAISGGASGYNSSILDFLDSYQAGQRNVDSKAVQYELARQQGMQDIMDMVGNGVRSSGVTLANSNSGASSAADAIAKAYGLIGRQQASKVGNQFAQGQEEVQAMQDNLTRTVDTQRRKNEESKTATINNIVNNATSALADLNSRAATASLPERVDIEARIAAIKQQAMQALSAYDATLNNGITGPMGADAIRAKATGMRVAGTAPEASFDYTTEAPTQFQGTGDFASTLPIFVSPNRKTQTVV